MEKILCVRTTVCPLLLFSFQVKSREPITQQTEKARQLPYKQDEVYYAPGGEAKLEVDGNNIPATEGGVIFVKAEAAQRFVNTGKGLKLLVFFSASESK